MYEALYPRHHSSHGHPNLARCLGGLGRVLQEQGYHGDARGYYERALAMYDALYPGDEFPHGHPDLAFTLDNLGRNARVPGFLRRGAGVLRAGRWRCSRPSTPGTASLTATATWPASLNSLGTVLV